MRGVFFRSDLLVYLSTIAQDEPHPSGGGGAFSSTRISFTCLLVY